jgi:hypothetical protein
MRGGAFRSAAGFFPARASSRKVVAGFRKVMMHNNRRGHRPGSGVQDDALVEGRRSTVERQPRYQPLAAALLLPRLNMPLRLSHNSTFTPLRRMMTYCWITERVLFQAQ